MRIFTNPITMFDEVKRDLYEMGTRYQTTTVQDQKVENDPRFQTIELTGYAYMLTGVSMEQLDPFLEKTGANPAWVFNELNERLHPKGDLNPGSAWKHDKEFWKQFLRDGFFSYSYAERWQEQLKYVIQELKLRPNTRQAMMTMYDRHQDMMNWGGRDRVPCSVSYQFLIRDGKLVLIYNQRSCDFVKFFPADVYCTMGLLRHVANKIGVERGQFIHFLGSLHAFAKDLEGEDIF